jgi:hypothetical protein
MREASATDIPRRPTLIFELSVHLRKVA